MIERLLAPVRQPVRYHNERLRRRLRKAGFDTSSVPLPAGRVHAWVGGAGPPLLLLQGFGSDAITQWAGVAVDLARHHRVIMPDMLFFGGSSSNVASPTLELQLAAVTELLDHLGVAAADVVGSSYGGFVAWGMALQSPARVRRLALLSCPGNALTRADLDRTHSSLEVANLADLIIPTEPAGVKQLLGIAMHPPPPYVPEFILRDVLEFGYSEHHAARRALLADLMRRVDDPPAELVSHSTLLLWGRHDRIFPLEVAERLALSMGERATLHVVPGAAHAPHASHPKVVRRVLLDWLRAS